MYHVGAVRNSTVIREPKLIICYLKEAREHRAEVIFLAAKEVALDRTPKSHPL